MLAYTTARSNDLKTAFAFIRHGDGHAGVRSLNAVLEHLAREALATDPFHIFLAPAQLFDPLRLLQFSPAEPERGG
jgi:hypothetical protein